MLTADVRIVRRDADMDLGEVLLLSGNRDQALAAFEHAVERYERKGNLVSTRRAQERLAGIGTDTRPSRT